MCGIAGIYQFKDGKAVDPALLQRMTDVIKHRGPDAEGQYVNGNLGLGHRRLSIIDLSEAGRQPMFSEDKQLCIVFNGEIYNFQEHRNALIQRGHRFHSHTDTEVILYLYREYGVDCVHSLRGMFAFALWDAHKRRLFLARDRIGQKPLYYYSDGRRLVFGSELKCLLEDPTIPREINYEALYDYLLYLYIPAPKTIYKHIYKLPPAHWMLCSPEGLRLQEYWDLSFAHVEEGRDESSWCQALIEQFREAVKIRLMSDVPLGAFLSGGVDSSGVVAMMAQAVKTPVLTTSIGFEEKAFDELPYAHIVSQQYQTDHFERVVHTDALSVIDDIVWHFDEPFADSSAVPTYYVSKHSREKVTVALSGDAGDENFAGYSKYPLDMMEEAMRRRVPDALKRWLIAPLAQIYPQWDWMPRYLRAKFFLTNLTQSHARGFFRTNTFMTQDLQDRVFSPDLRRAVGGYDPFRVVEQAYRRADTADPLSKVQYVDLKVLLPEDMLVKVDRMSMAHSLEVRSPILDHLFMEFIATIPSSLKLHGQEKKYIFKKALAPYLPDTILYRQKQGFEVPLDTWFRQELKGLVQETLLAPHALQRGLFNASYLKRMWQQHQSGQRNFGTNFWTLLMFELWYRRFMGHS
ncbi:asparagine synthase (glutamine-hydrolyzing) [candidate division KSB3 bacterium]|uniref:asparagine synthase (glutamine-hydrolyzing) n=1 Tax=candidate division KSB3 bacterium TaxID=2044937 RepID=A0A9D5JS10_9BACT|nr:asparagine synthase (glutamine-hydrolyzing) [candidate division KSB3 bacterium]MBD3322957.1 asparagine synthase (glutamine-hydrolyzing) [candidate division KSB3 bacterium]